MKIYYALCILLVLAGTACRHSADFSGTKNVNITIANSKKHFIISDIGNYNDAKSLIVKLKQSHVSRVSIMSERMLVCQTIDALSNAFKVAEIEITTFIVPSGSYICGAINLANDSPILKICPQKNKTTYLLGYSRSNNKYYEAKDLNMIISFMKKRNVKSLNIISDEELPPETEKYIYTCFVNAKIKMDSFISCKDTSVGFSNIVIDGKLQNK